MDRVQGHFFVYYFKFNLGVCSTCCLKRLYVFFWVKVYKYMLICTYYTYIYNNLYIKICFSNVLYPYIWFYCFTYFFNIWK